MDSDAIQKAIVDEIDGDATLSGLVGTDRYFSIAPDDTGWPYLVFHIVSDVPQRTFTGTVRQRLRVQFSVFSKGFNPASGNAIIDALETVFEGANLTVAGYASVSCLRIGGQVIHEDGVYHHWQDYEVFVQPT